MAAAAARSDCYRIKRQIDDRHLLRGTKLPSIRNFAETYNVSRFTVVEAYDRLVARGIGCHCTRNKPNFLSKLIAS
jgi:DNA-binding transcriptional MocR family regulator